MAVSSATFDSSMARWTEEQRTPWSQLKYALVHANLQRHLGTAPLKILDAGGGNGLDSIPLALAGHSVVIVDYSAAMLADAADRVHTAGLQDRVTTRRADLAMLPALFSEHSFDAVLCHNVVQYAEDVPALLASVLTPLKEGGMISVVSVNRHSVPYHAAFLRGNLEEALVSLDQQSAHAMIFETTMQLHGGEEIADLLTQAGCTVDQHYGIRCLCDYWGDNARKADPHIFAQIEKLELALTHRHPYKLLARYFQIIAHKI